ncbi:MAG TPA: xanthine dehydrogenase family protein molybdopterin-binding subunit [Geminicoccus sp.]|uniref:xanthine dehydrogenase family protein molybdopterin-binding subunit n=1 Tax=Geminicoccus sp. TaxID=2024832 RepID=UPI002C810557|nr:xanthine dehydrogenase family protein molybdopterin-binding subunit [Geminicoccus sp.]HWL71061.1 xanthine dehydrogenase family protein molybdopterin-binding subunit [Geminicoccus sp.]
MNAPMIGLDLPRRDAADKLRGQTRYTVDRARPGMLHGALRRAEVPAARIVRVDLEPARRMPGVRAVVGSAEAPGRSGMVAGDQTLFATGEVRFAGEPIAAVAADTAKQARAAAAAIVVELEPLPPVLTMAEALAPDAPLVHPGWRDYPQFVPGGQRAGNVAWEATVVRDDVAAAFARPDVTVVESRFRVGRQNQASLEPRACIATFEDGRVLIETSTQAPWTVRDATASLLGMRPADVRVVVPAVGGGFGLKFAFGLEPFAALLARAAGRPVRLANSRRDEMLTALCRENAEIRIRSAVTVSGEIAGREAVVLMDCGAYGGEQPFLASMTAHTLGGSYRLGAVRLVSQAIYTNTPPTGAFRACNGAYNVFALERHTDEICQAIGMDPLEFRKRNVIGDKAIGATGQVFEGDVLGPMLDRMMALRDKAPKRPLVSDGRLVGRATVVGTWLILVGPSAATVNLNPDGTATVVTSGVEIGSGAMVQALPQIVAHSLGLRPEDVVVRQADTDAAGYDVGVGGGRTTVSLGAASIAACQEVRTKLLQIASDMLEAAPDDLVLEAGHVQVVGAPQVRVSIAAVAQRAQGVSGPISGSGAFTAPGTASRPGCTAGSLVDALDLPVFAVHECEVAVDPETGQVEVLAYRVVQDVGRAINPRAIHGQIQGGVVQGLGYALHEEVTIGPDGQVRQQGFETYRVPLAQDVVPVEIDLYEGAPSIGPLGTKGAGEVPILNVAAAVACAVANATGRPVREIPLTPPRVLELLDGAADELRLPHIKARWEDNLLGAGAG